MKKTIKIISKVAIFLLIALAGVILLPEMDSYIKAFPYIVGSLLFIYLYLLFIVFLLFKFKHSTRIKKNIVIFFIITIGLILLFHGYYDNKIRDGWVCMYIMIIIDIIIIFTPSKKLFEENKNIQLTDLSIYTDKLIEKRNKVINQKVNCHEKSKKQ